MGQHEQWREDEQRALATRGRSKVRLVVLYRSLAVLLIATGIAGMNGAIYFSSMSHYHNMGWALVCGLNAVWLGVVGVLTLCYAESHEVAMRQLNWDERSKAGV